MVNQTPFVILGAGPAGIAAALALGADAVVLEKRPGGGGLTSSMTSEGAIFDLGGHTFHTPHPQVRELVYSALPMVEQPRVARCYVQGAMIPYPFQQYFHCLENAAVVEACSRGLQEAAGGAGAANLEAYLVGRFGAGIARHFLLPYNARFWGRDLQQLSTDWVGARVAAPQGVPEAFSPDSGQRKPLQADTVVAYPARGGFGEILSALARRVHNLRVATPVLRVHPRQRELVTTAGDVYQWQQLISTLPINELLARCDHVPAALLQEAASLEYVSLQLIFAVLDHPLATEIQRIYVADARLPAHKIVLNNNSSDYLRSLPHHGISGEIACAGAPDAATRADQEQQFVESLLELQLIQARSEILKISSLHLRYAYPVPTHERAAIIARIKAWLARYGIYSIGRFGEWDYINSDEAIFRGLTLGQALAGRVSL